MFFFPSSDITVEVVGWSNRPFVDETVNSVIYGYAILQKHTLGKADS
jgi:hypothetical protein